MLRRLSLFVALAAAAVCLSLNAGAQETGGYVTKHARMDRSRMNIGVYHLAPYARTESHIKDLSECGIDFVMYMNNDPAVLDLFSKYNVGAIIVGTVPLWWGGFGDNAGTLRATHPLTEYEEAAAKFKDHPAIWGIAIGDEPSCLDFPYYNEIVRTVEKGFPNQFAHLNLHPTYAPGPRVGNDPTKGALGAATYQEYIDAYCKWVPADYIAYDYYYQHGGVPLDLANMRIVADACLATGRSMWPTVQVNSNKLEEWISLNQLRFQAWSAMAFGAENITWACYTWGWWYNQVLYGDGSKTQQYDKLKQVNAEIHAFSPAYMKYKRVSTSCVGFQGTDMLEGSGMENVEIYNDETFKNLSAGCPLIVGKMTSRSGRRGKALFICVSDDPYDKNPQTHTLSFKCRRRISVTSNEGPVPVKRLCGGRYEIPVTSNQGILIEVK